MGPEESDLGREGCLLRKRKPGGEGIWNTSCSGVNSDPARGEICSGTGLCPYSRLSCTALCAGPPHVTQAQRRMQRIWVINCFQISNKSHMHIHKHPVTME